MGIRTNVKQNKTSPVRLSLDVPMLIIVAVLVVVGMLTVYSATWEISWHEFADVNKYFLRQLVWLGIGLASAAALFLIDYHRWERDNFALYAILATIVLLAGVLARGGRNLLAGKSVQPSELAKLTVVIYLAVWLYSKKDDLRQVGFGIVPLGVILGLVGGLIAVQPDVSAAATVFFLGLLMFFLAGGSFWQTSVFVIIAGALGGGLVSIVKPEAFQRVRDFVDGLFDITAVPAQVGAAISAFREGGWFGVGPGRGIAKLVLVPVPHTDSIFAVVGEELGVLGATVLVILYGLFLWRGLTIARKATDDLGVLLASGLTLWIVFEAYVNMAVIIGLLPVAGNPLPFISLGGSNLVVSLTAVGIILNIGRSSDQERDLLERRASSAVVDLRGRNGRRSVSGHGRSASNPKR
ncbi:MAG: FtsW/RodA/SpoVE family cell cycle protein [Chloroflexota bacterium]|nr:FtsW/RodA/SpoVE family cell cycle protein [Chloroflexota bacterium]